MFEQTEQKRQEQERSGHGAGPHEATGPGATAATAPDRLRLGSGTRAYWDEFARRQGHEMVRCVARAMRRVGWRADPGELDELVQEVYCRILEGRAPRGLGGWPQAQLWAYLHRIAKSVVVDELRSRGARKRGGQRPRPGDAPADRVPARSLVDRRAPGPTVEERLLAREEAAALRRRVCELDAEHGARNLRILELAAIEGCTALEISRHLAGALTPSSVHTVLYRLRRQLTPASDGLTI